MKFVIFAPTLQTGGPFALYQLHDAILKHNCESEVVFYQRAQYAVKGAACQVNYAGKFTPPTMANITPKVCTKFSKDDVLIFPEILLNLLVKFHKIGFQKTAYWWLSWNNAPIERLNRLDYAAALSSTMHLFQSKFSRINVQNFGYQGLDLSDYTLFNHELTDTPCDKKYDICYFGKKAEGAEEVLRKLAERYNVIKIEKMTQGEVALALRETRFFLDFGIHPGKDRIPREATMYGCVPIVRRVGAAAHFEDVPLPDILRPTSVQMINAAYLSDLIQGLKRDEDNIQKHLEAYKQKILNERDCFMEETRVFIEAFKAN